MGQQVSVDQRSLPRAGDRYRCTHCRMEIEVISDCSCEDPEQVRLQCCGRDMLNVSSEARPEERLMEHPPQDMVDEASEESFPASDPPAQY